MTAWRKLWKDGSRGHRGLDVRGVTEDGRLIRFASSKPGDARTAGKISGLVTDTKLVGIDYRPATGADSDQGDLYGLGNAGGVYVVTPTTPRPASSRGSTSRSRARRSASTSTRPSIACA